jgi:hypothetical protein
MVGTVHHDVPSFDGDRAVKIRRYNVSIPFHLHGSARGRDVSIRADSYSWKRLSFDMLHNWQDKN